jgi:antitoxin component of MazEF toxin-antitoxin module
MELKPRYMRVQKHSDEGNQLTITIPSEFARILSIDRGDTVKVTLEKDKRIVVEATE